MELKIKTAKGGGFIINSPCDSYIADNFKELVQVLQYVLPVMPENYLTEAIKGEGFE